MESFEQNVFRSVLVRLTKCSVSIDCDCFLRGLNNAGVITEYDEIFKKLQAKGDPLRKELYLFGQVLPKIPNTNFPKCFELLRETISLSENFRELERFLKEQEVRLSQMVPQSQIPSATVPTAGQRGGVNDTGFAAKLSDFESGREIMMTDVVDLVGLVKDMKVTLDDVKSNQAQINSPLRAILLKDEKFNGIDFKRGLVQDICASGLKIFNQAQKKILQNWIEPVLYSRNDHKKFGLTTAFAIQTLQSIDTSLHRPQALILTSSIESARKMHYALLNFGHSIGATVQWQPISVCNPKEFMAHVIVAYPIRLQALHVFLQSCDTNRENYVTFYDISDGDAAILAHSVFSFSEYPKTKVTSMSADGHYCGNIHSFAQMVFAEKPKRTVFNVTPAHHYYLTVSDRQSDDLRHEQKAGYLRVLADEYPKVVVYCDEADITHVATTLKTKFQEIQGSTFEIYDLHEGVVNEERKSVIDGFREQAKCVLVSSVKYVEDIDTKKASLIVNYDPSPVQCYPDCVGDGDLLKTVLTFLKPSELDFVKMVREHMGIEIRPRELEEV